MGLRSRAALLALAAFLPAVSLARPNGIAGYSGKTGATCSSCHTAGAPVPTVAIAGPTTLAPGDNGSYTVTITGGPAQTAGVDVAVSSASATLQVVDATTTKLLSGELVQSAATPFSGNSVSYAFQLTAPSSNGSVTLYAAGLSSDGKSTTSGDGTGVAQLVVNVQASGNPPTIAQPAAASPSTVSGTTTALSVLGADSSGESTLTYTWSAPAGSGVSFSPNGTNAAKSSTATFTSAGTYALQVLVKDGAGLTATSSVSVTVNATPTAVSVSPASATVAPGGTQAFAASLVDQFSHPISPTPPITWSVSGGGTIDINGTFTAGSSAGGPFFVTAAAGSASGSASVSVGGGGTAPPSVVNPASANPGTVTGTSCSLSVLGSDSHGESSLTYTWSAPAGAGVTFSPNGTNAAKNATATFSSVGSYTLTVTLQDSGGLTATSAVQVNVQATPAVINLSPTTTSVQVGGTQLFIADVEDQFDHDMDPTTPVTWAVSGGGTIDPSGIFSATDVGGPYTVTASLNALQSTAQLTVSVQPGPVFVQEATATPSEVTGTTAELYALGDDPAGGEAALTYTWKVVDGQGVVFSQNGTNDAKRTTATFPRPDSYELEVIIQDGQGLTASSLVSVHVYESIGGFTLVPPNAQVRPGGTQQFKVNLLDQYGRPFTPMPGIVWAVTGGGVVDSAGVFHADPNAGGPFTITARTAGGLAEGTVVVGQGTGSKSASGCGCTAALPPGELASAALLLYALLGRRRRR